MYLDVEIKILGIDSNWLVLLLIDRFIGTLVSLFPCDSFNVRMCVFPK